MKEMVGVLRFGLMGVGMRATGRKTKPTERVGSSMQMGMSMRVTG